MSAPGLRHSRGMATLTSKPLGRIKCVGGIAPRKWKQQQAARKKRVRKVTMKTAPAPNVPGKTDFERFDNAVRQVLTVSKEELLKREQRESDSRERAKAKKPKK